MTPPTVPFGRLVWWLVLGAVSWLLVATLAWAAAVVA